MSTTAPDRRIDHIEVDGITIPGSMISAGADFSIDEKRDVVSLTIIAKNSIDVEYSR